jgi:hypothetical protein
VAQFWLPGDEEIQPNKWYRWRVDYQPWTDTDTTKEPKGWIAYYYAEGNGPWQTVVRKNNISLGYGKLPTDSTAWNNKGHIEFGNYIWGWSGLKTRFNEVSVYNSHAAVNLRQPTETTLTLSGLQSTFDQTWDANKTNWNTLVVSPTAPAGGSHPLYTFGNYICPSLSRAAMATQDGKYIADAKVIIDNLIGQTVDASSRFGSGYLSWAGVDQGFTTWLDDLQFAHGVTGLCDLILNDRVPATQDQKSWAASTVDWVDRHILDKQNGMTNIADWPYLQDKIWLWVGSCLNAKSAMSAVGLNSRVVGTPADGDSLATQSLDEMFYSGRSDLARTGYIDETGAVVYEQGIPERSFWEGLRADVIHANRFGKVLWEEWTRHNGQGHVTDEMIAAASRTVTNYIWNGGTGLDLRFSTYVDGYAERFGQGTHPTTGEEDGWGWLYNGWAYLNVVNDAIARMEEEILEVQMGRQYGITNKNATHNRYNTYHGLMGACSNLMVWLEDRDPSLPSSFAPSWAEPCPQFDGQQADLCEIQITGVTGGNADLWNNAPFVLKAVRGETGKWGLRAKNVTAPAFDGYFYGPITGENYQTGPGTSHVTATVFGETLAGGNAPQSNPGCDLVISTPHGSLTFDSGVVSQEGIWKNVPMSRVDGGVLSDGSDFSSATLTVTFKKLDEVLSFTI